MLTVNQYALYMALQTVKHAMPKNDVRNYLNGIHLKREGEALAVTATDGHRLTHCAVTVDAGNDFELIICAKKLPQILAFIKCKAGTSTIELDVTNSTLGGLVFDVIECDRYPNVEMMFVKFANGEPVKLNGMNGKYLTDMSRAFTALSKYGAVRMTIAPVWQPTYRTGIPRECALMYCIGAHMTPSELDEALAGTWSATKC